VITDIGCLSDTALQTVTTFDPPVAAFTVQSAACLNKAITFNSNASSSGAAVLVKWYWNFGDNTATLTSTNPNPVQHTYTKTGTYDVSLQVEINSGCKSLIKTIPVSVYDLPVADFIMPAICLNDPAAQFIDSSHIADNSQAGFTYLWNFGNGQTANQKDPKGNFTATGVYDVMLTVTTNNGCVHDTTKKFTVNGTLPMAVFSVANSSKLCSNKPISITDASTVDFGNIIRTEIYWDYTGNPLAKTVDSFPAKGKTYSYRYADFGSPAAKTYQIRYIVYSGISCLSQAVNTINLQASPQLQFDTLLPVCEEIAAFQVTAAKDNSVLAGTAVYTGKGISATGIFNPAQAGPGSDLITYSVAATNGCRADTARTILVYPAPVVSAGADKYLLEGNFIILDGQATGNNNSYAWTPATYLDNAGVARPKVTAPQDMLYTLEVTSPNGCRGTDDVTVKVLKQIKVPNAFSPNGDGINDTWFIQYLESYPDCTVDVYNRYGQPVYHSTGYTKQWDGKINGQPLPTGTYYWIIKPGSGRLPVNGSVTIIR
jgi:gliding motility-associated-like protein